MTFLLPGNTPSDPAGMPIGALPPCRVAVRCASSLFGAVVACRTAMYDRLPFLSKAAPYPVISIGGIRAGGTGKTPVALLVGRHLLSQGREVAFLSRGYGRKDRRPRIVAPYETTAWELVGDEPWLLHKRLPQSWLGIDAQRGRAVHALTKTMHGPATFVLDDGFQHRALRRTIDIVCLDDTTLHDRLLPAGFLRERVASLSRATVGLVIGSAAQRSSLRQTRDVLARRFPGLPLYVLFQEKDRWINAGTGEEAQKPPVTKPLLVCGIARPERFLDMVRRDGITPRAERIFPDHHYFITNDFPETRELYYGEVITTEKDTVRLCGRGIIPDEKVWFLSIRLCFEEPSDNKYLYQLIDKHISNF
ncbi:MAG: tetraacyldisaccharide 4'-kinase [Chitinispirillaceae bacterium]|nr:tetraacyldisaccharide 4'-kinase [Chitinispirillaceae bacterium]